MARIALKGGAVGGENQHAEGLRLGRVVLLVIHWGIILHFLIQIGYSSYMVFVALRPPGVSGPLFGAALDLGFEDMVTRRLYASENWIATSGLAIYLALTEIGPRLRRARGRD